MKTKQHPDLAELELLRTGEEAVPEVRRHIEDCAECRGRLEQLKILSKNLQVRQSDVLQTSSAADANMQGYIRRRAVEIRRVGQIRPFPVLLRYVAGLAAMLVIGMGVVWILFISSTDKAPALAGDFNRDGRVDVIDAYLLSQAVEKGAALEVWDLNHDGQVDREDAAALARRIVGLGT